MIEIYVILITLIITSIPLFLLMLSFKKEKKIRQQDYFEELLDNLPFLNSPEELIHILAMGIFIFSNNKLIKNNIFYVKKYLEDILKYPDNDSIKCDAAVSLYFCFRNIRDKLGIKIFDTDILDIVQKSSIFTPREIK